ncbi:TetR family transcriptional regulator [Tamaricihabitans halophyticus]|uniref:TetR family transcriptional regulator n=1 Tax=Tamaricihabitans halophyticus TaxID=1262583 RepID=A0A4V2SSY1_9PSEU|nr:TetR/AcrR family transcriptional regulator [Tamaricihabitans halophyticus]TCP48636.1 TetR family transcriptional regulator [Tamaricihabitans halophyticus]
MVESGLRERRKSRTRAALLHAAVELFERQGYAETTVAQVAEAAGVSTKTLFNYVSGKEDLIFAGRLDRIADADELLSEFAASGAGPAQALRMLLDRIVARVGDEPAGMALNIAQTRLITEVPELRSRALLLMQEVQRKTGATLHAAYPDKFDALTAAAAVGSLFGAIQSAVLVVLDRGGSAEEVMDVIRLAGEQAAAGLERTIG